MADERVLAVIPARGGSKGIPKKNIQIVGGEPLLVLAVDALQASGVELDVAVSSDADDILATASGCRGVFALRRPDEISADTAKSEDALIDALEQMSRLHGREYTSVFTVQPTSPFRTSDTVRRFAKRWQQVHEDGEYDAMLTLHATYADYWVCDDGGFHRLYPDAPRRRQERNPLYVENSCLYATDVAALRRTRSVLGTKPCAFIIDEQEALDINEPIDLEFARVMAARNV